MATVAKMPGPPILAFLPEQDKVYLYGKTNVDPFNIDETLVRIRHTVEIDEVPVLVDTTVPREFSYYEGVTVGVSKTAGQCWAVYDAAADAPGGYEGSYLAEFTTDTGEIVRAAKVRSAIPLPAGQHVARIAELSGAHSFFDLGCDALLTCNRNTGQLIRLKLTKGATRTAYWSAVIDKIYGLTIAPLDGAINADGTRLSYIDGMHVRIWDLENDRFFRTVV